MNTKLVIIGCFVIILMVFFGENPIEEARKEQELKYKGLKDPLMRAIQDYHEENSFGTNTVGNGRREGGASTRSGSVVEYPAHMMHPQNQQRVNPYNSQNNRQAAPNVRQMQFPKDNNNNNLNNNNYYPPPPVGGGSSQMQAPFSPHGQQPHKMLQGGQRLAYNGTKVFFYDKNGRMKPLPDGRYVTVDGRELLIIGGEKTVASN